MGAQKQSMGGPSLANIAFLLPLVAAAIAALGFKGREILLGVDLGTTFSTLAYRENGVVHVLKLSDGRDAAWSAVAIVDDQFVVGEPARLIARDRPESVILDSKRVIGRGLFDEMVISEAPRHHGRLTEHPVVRRSTLQGKQVPPGKPCPPEHCRPDLAFAIPLHTQTAEQRAALASHKCIDPGSLVDIATASAPESVRQLSRLTHPPAVGGTRMGAAHTAGKGGQQESHARVGGAQYYLLVTPQAVGCIILSHLMSSAKSQLDGTTLPPWLPGGLGGRKVHVPAWAERIPGLARTWKAMACVPAEFSHSQRQATLDAFASAGIYVVRTLHEPTAAAVAYGVHRRKEVRQVLVFDMGGGTLDVSVLFLAHGTTAVEGVTGSGGALPALGAGWGGGGFTVIGAAGDNALGGEDVDACVVSIMSQQLESRAAAGGSSSQCTPEVLKSEAERVKISLSGDGGKGAQQVVAWGCGSTAVATITNEQFESSCSPLFDRTLEPVRAALDNAALEPGDVHEVVLVGGSSRLPAVRRRLSEYLGGRELHSTVDPDLAVALGAAGSGD